VFFARLDEFEKEKRTNETNLEYIHIPSTNYLGNDTRIFEHVLWNMYEPPPGFSWDMV